jgi:hypothetical protein
MRLQHGSDVLHDRCHLRQIVIADADHFADAAIGHARRIFHHDGGEQRVRHVDRIFVEGANARMAPADVFHRAFDRLVGRAYPFADAEGPIEVDGESAEEVGQQIFRGKAHCDTADTAQRQYACDAYPQRLQAEQQRRHHHHETAQLAQRIDCGAVDLVAAREPRGDDVLADPVDKAQQEPGEADDDADVAQRHDIFEERFVDMATQHIDRQRQADQPDRNQHGLAGAAHQCIVPHVGCACGDAPDVPQQEFGQQVGRRRYGQDDDDAGDPGLGEKTQADSMDELCHGLLRTDIERKTGASAPAGVRSAPRRLRRIVGADDLALDHTPAGCRPFIVGEGRGVRHRLPPCAPPSVRASADAARASSTRSSPR